MPESSMQGQAMPDAVVLCGGAGTRLRSVTGGAPKSLASVAGRPFLELLLRQLRRSGFRRAILAVGYRKEMISSFLGNEAFGLRLSYAEEDSPLGTGGAVRNAAGLVETDAVLVTNGDSYTDVDLSDFVAAHKRSAAEVSIVVVPVDGRGDIGSVIAGPDGTVLRFAEKESAAGASSLLNAGIYMLSRSLLFEIAAGKQVSLEKELFPRWLRAGKNMKIFYHPGTCVDIGTPERYQLAQKMLAAVEAKQFERAGHRH